MKTGIIPLDALDREEALRYIGVKDGNPDDITKERLDECEKIILDNAVGRYLYEIHDITPSEEGIVVGNTTFVLTGNSIREHLAGCSKAVLLCATISSEVDRIIRVTQLKDIHKALLLDSFASVAIEQLCDKVEERIIEENEGMNFTWRFGIGYGDLDIKLQKEFLNVCGAPKKIGLCTSETCMLTPIKSVTAVIGMSKEEIPKRLKGCMTCNLKGKCAYSKKGGHCNG